MRRHKYFWTRCRDTDDTPCGSQGGRDNGAVRAKRLRRDLWLVRCKTMFSDFSGHAKHCMQQKIPYSSGMDLYLFGAAQTSPMKS